MYLYCFSVKLSVIIFFLFVASLHFSEPWRWSCQSHCCIICVWFHWNATSLETLLTSSVETGSMSPSGGSSQSTSSGYSLSAGATVHGQPASTRVEWWVLYVLKWKLEIMERRPSETFSSLQQMPNTQLSIFFFFLTNLVYAVFFSVW